jgi:hypothetical protein
MNQPSLYPPPTSYTDAVIDTLTAKPGEYVDGLALARIAGAYAWRSRVSDARRILRATGRGDIVNEQVRAKGRPTRSLYRFVPTEGC